MLTDNKDISHICYFSLNLTGIIEFGDSDVDKILKTLSRISAALLFVSSEAELVDKTRQRENKRSHCTIELYLLIS